MLQLARQLLGTELWESLKANRPGLLRVQQGWGSADFDWDQVINPQSAVSRCNSSSLFQSLTTHSSIVGVFRLGILGC